MVRTEAIWAKSSPNYARILNGDTREKLGWKKPFEIYYDIELNVLWHANNDEVDFEQTMEDAKYKIKDRYYEKHNKKNMRNHTKRYSEKKQPKKPQQLIERYLPTKIYDVGSNVLIQGTKRNGVSNTKLWHVTKGRI